MRWLYVTVTYSRTVRSLPVSDTFFGNHYKMGFSIFTSASGVRASVNVLFGFSLTPYSLFRCLFSTFVRLSDSNLKFLMKLPHQADCVFTVSLMFFEIVLNEIIDFLLEKLKTNWFFDQWSIFWGNYFIMSLFRI